MPTHTAAGLGHEPMPGKETRKKVSEKSEEKSIRGQSMKPLTSIDVLVEEEKQEGKKRKNKKKETWIRPPSHLPWTMQSPPMASKEYRESLFFKPPQSTGRVIYIKYIYIYIYIY